MFNRGDQVEVKGFRGDRAVLRVWEARGDRGLLLCSESGFERLVAGSEAPLVGYPMSDVVGVVQPIGA